MAGGIRELEWFTVGNKEGVREWVESKIASEDESGDNIGGATNAWVAGLASLRPVKLRLQEVMIELTPPFLMIRMLATLRITSEWNVGQ